MGSNKLVGKPGTFGVIHRQARPRPNASAIPSRREIFEGPLHGARAYAKRQCQGGTGPRLAIGKQGKQSGMVAFDGRRQHHDILGGVRPQCKPSSGGGERRQRSDRRPQPSDFDPQSRAVQLVGMPCPERTPEKRFAWHVTRPRAGQRPSKREQHRARDQRDGRCPGTDGPPARIHDKRVRGQQRLDLLKMNHALQIPGDDTRRWCPERPRRLVDLGCKGRDACAVCGPFGPFQRISRLLCPDTPDGNAGYHKLAPNARGGWQGIDVDRIKHLFGFIKTADQKKAPGFEIARMRGVPSITLRFEHDPSGVECLQRPAEITRNKRDLSLGDDTARPGNRLFRAEGASRASQKLSGTRKIAKLRHRDAAQRQRRRIIAQGDPLQRCQRVTRRQGAPRRVDQGVHG